MVASAIPETFENDFKQILESQSNLLALTQQNIQRPAAELPHPDTVNILSSMEKITSSLLTLDQKFSAFRSAQHLAHVSRIHPKTKTVVFAGSGYLGDNIKYAYLAFLERAKQEGVACTFLPHNPAQYEQLKAEGLPCLPYGSSNYTTNDRDILLSTKVLLLDNHFVPPNWRNQIPHALLSGAKTVQLWHGIPLKKIGLETVASVNIDDPNAAEFFAACGSFDVFIAPSASSRTDWERQFSFQSFAPLGYPRNDVFFRDITASDKINVDTEALDIIQQSNKKGQPVILYTPTFRDYEGSRWFLKAEISAFSDYCDAHGYLCYVNLHPAEQESVEQFRQRYPNIKFIAPHTDIYPIVKYADVLITDYSSLAFDFLLLDRPLIFYRPDHEDYVTRSRPLIEDHEQYICGAVTTNIGELVKAVEAPLTVNKHTDPYRNTRQALRQKLFDHHDGLATQRLNDEIIKLVEAHT